MHKKFEFLYGSKSKIGWTHGLLACVGALICAYLTMMIATSVIKADIPTRILPSAIFTPILMSLYGLFFLFAPKLITVLQRIGLCILILSLVLFLAMKVT